MSSSSEAKDLGAVITSVASEILHFVQNDSRWSGIPFSLTPLCKRRLCYLTAFCGMCNTTLRPTPKAFFHARVASISLFRSAKKYRVHREGNIYSSLAESVRFWCFRTLKNRRFFASRAICACLACASTDSRTLDYHFATGETSLAMQTSLQMLFATSL